MVERDELMHRAVAGLRASRSPASGAQARVLAALELELGGPSGGDGGLAGGGGSAAPVTAGWIAKVVGATAGLTAGGLLVMRLGVGVMRALAGEEEPAQEQAKVEAEPAEQQVALADPPALVEAESAVAIHEHVAAPSKRPAKPSEAASADTLAAEAALIGAAKRASAPEATLELLEQHAEKFPDGKMASEREVLAVKALCQLDRTDEARTRARSLIAQRPGLPLLDRMRRDCPALADLLRQTSP
jgi:hypothetical protein